MSRSPYNNNINSMLANYTRGSLNPGGNVGGLNVGGNSGLTGLGAAGLSPSSSLQRGGLGSDPLASPGTSSMMGIPASPRSFSSNNLSALAGSSGLAASSLARQVGSSLNRLEQQEHQLQQLQQQSAATPQQQQQQHQSSSQQESSHGQQNLQQSHSLGNGQQLQNHQVLGGTGLSSGQQLQALGLATGQQLQSPQSLGGVSLDAQADQHNQLLVPKVEVKQEEDLQHQGGQHGQRPDSLLSPQLQRQDIYQLQQRQQQQQQQQQQSQQMLNIYQQQRLLQQQQQHQQQHQQQQHLLQSLPQHLQRPHIQQQQQQQQQQQLHQQQAQQQMQQQQQAQQQAQQQQQANLLQNAGPPKQPTETSVCARRLMNYMYHQRHRPQDNNISFWRKFVAEYFGPGAKKRWCVALYGSGGRQPTGVFPQDVWHCEICGTKPGRGFETTVEVLPRLCKIKYDSGILEELLFVDLPHEYKLSSGHMVLEYGKAIQESVFDALRVVRDGQLRIIFSADLKILSWEFCARSHEELLPRRLILPQVTQLATIAQKYQTSSTQNGGAGLSLQDMQTNCHLFVTSARQLHRTLDVPTVNDLGYTKRYVRCLQISEVVNSIKDLIDFSRENKMGPIESLVSFPRRTGSGGGQSSQSIQQQQQQQHQQHQQQQQQQAQLALQNMVSDQSASTLSALQDANTLSALQQQLAVSSGNSGGNNVTPSVNGSMHSSNPLGSFSNHLHPSSLASLQGSLQNSSNSLGGALQSPTSMQASPTNSISSFQPSLTTLSGALQPSNLNTFSNTIQSNSLNSAAANLLQQQSSMQTGQSAQQDSQNAVHHLLQEMMMNQQMNSGNFQQGMGGSNVGGNVGVNSGLVASVGGLNTLGGSGSLGHGSSVIGGSSNGVLSNHLGGNNNTSLGGGLGGSLSSSLGSGSNNILGSTLRNVGSLGNMSAMSALSGRLNLAGGSQQHNLQMQDPGQGLHHDLAGNSMLGSLGAGGGFGGLQFNWKSP